MTLKFRGWKQILLAAFFVIAVLISYTAWRQGGLDEHLPQILARQLKADVGNEIVHNNLPIGQGTQSISRKQGEYLEKEFRTLDSVKIISLEKRGWGASLTVRVTFSVERTPGNRSEETRYYRVKHNWISDWFVSGPSNKSAYGLAWLF